MWLEISLLQVDTGVVSSCCYTLVLFFLPVVEAFWFATVLSNVCCCWACLLSKMSGLVVDLEVCQVVYLNLEVALGAISV